MSFGKHLMKKLQKKLSLGNNDSELSSLAEKQAADNDKTSPMPNLD